MLIVAKDWTALYKKPELGTCSNSVFWSNTLSVSLRHNINEDIRAKLQKNATVCTKVLKDLTCYASIKDLGMKL